MVINLSDQHSLINNWVSELRNVEIQTDRMRFRRNLERIAEVAAYEISKELPWEEKEIQTPIGIATCKVLKEQPVFATILRAGLAMHNGMLSYFEQQIMPLYLPTGNIISMALSKLSLEYMSCPPLEDRIVIITDPMLGYGFVAGKNNSLYERRWRT